MEKRTSFVLRFFEVSADRGRWQGQVEHVQSGAKRPFHGAHQLLRILHELSAEREVHGKE